MMGSKGDGPYPGCLPCLHSQVLSPCLAARARTFGRKLALKDEWVPVDNTYFDATGGCLWTILTLMQHVRERVDKTCFPLQCQSVSYAVLMIDNQVSFQCRSSLEVQTDACQQTYGLM